MMLVYTDKPLPERAEHDAYMTHKAFVSAAVEYVRRFVTGREPRILDPGAGDGRWGQKAREIWPGAHIEGVEIQDLWHPAGFDVWHPSQDYLTWQPDRQFDLVIGNPPFNLLEEFVYKSLSVTKEWGLVALLGPSTFLGSIGRGRGLWQETPFFRAVVSMRRVRFDGHGDNPIRDMNLYMWWPGYRSSTPTIDWLDWDLEG